MMFLPQDDSAELSFMKQQFGVVNSKLDQVLSGQDEMKAALDMLQLTNSIDPIKIHHLKRKVTRLQPRILNDLWRREKLTTRTKRQLESLINEFREAQLEPMLKALIWAITGNYLCYICVCFFFGSDRSPKRGDLVRAC